MSDERNAPEEFARLQLALAGTWSVERELGAGGMGRVYLARDVALDRPVALKVLRPDLAAQPDARARFLREARTGARLSHPNIVPIYAVDERDDLVFFVMGLVDGETLGERVRREGPVDSAVAQQLVREVGWALGYAHATGIVHRDVTLENILIERSTGRCLLADFGIAAEIDRAGEGPLLGTPTYLAPEVIQGEPATPRSDIYALSVAGWFMLTGRPPFLADDVAALLMQHLAEPVPPLDRAAPAASSRLVRAITQGLAKDPADRPADMEAWLALVRGDGEAVQLARPLRMWINRRALIRPAYALGATVIAMLTLEMALQVIDGTHQFLPWRDLLRFMTAWIPAMIRAMLPVLGTVLVIHLIVEYILLRRVAKAGFGVEDVRLALARQQADALRAGPVQPSRLGRIVNDLAWLSGIVFLLTMLMIVPNIRYLVAGADWVMRSILLQKFVTLMQWTYVAFWSGIGFGFLVPATATAPEGLMARMQQRFWQSRAGALLLRIAAAGMPRQLAATETLHRPTELVLDLAIDDLWQALPPVTRDALGNLPEVADKLRRRIGELRELERMLERPTLARSAEARALREHLGSRRREGIAALEQLRLQVATLGSATDREGALTEQLADARALEMALLAELGVHGDLRRALRKGRRPEGISLEPTPA